MAVKVNVSVGVHIGDNLSNLRKRSASMGKNSLQPDAEVRKGGELLGNAK